MKIHFLLLVALLFFPVIIFGQSSSVAAGSNDSGYYNRTGADLLFGNGTSTARYFTINGYRFNQYISAGMGIGYVPYNDPLGLIPIFTDLTYNFTDGDVSPYLYVRLGYSYSTQAEDDVTMETHNGGVMINPGIGLQFATGQSWGWYLNTGFNRDRSVHSYETWGNQTVSNSYSYKRVYLGIGVVF